MTIFHAFWAGFSSFFSIWILCLLQVVPFFFAFIVGTMLPTHGGTDQKAWNRALVAVLASFAGYTVMFVLMGMTTTGISKVIFGNLYLVNQLGGVVVGLAGFYMAGLLTLGDKAEGRARKILPLVGFLLGGALAVAYKPCITPALTVIINLNNAPQTAGIGALMLAFYTLGVSTAILSVGLALAVACMRLLSTATWITARRACGAVLLVAAFLIISGMMNDYKSLLVGGLTPESTGMEHMDHSHHEGMEH